MKVSRLIAPYRSNGKVNIGFTQRRSGVYLIYKNGKLCYIGFSGTNLYSTILRHFQEWNDRQGPRVTYYRQLASNNFQLRIVLCGPDRAARLEKALIIRHRPKDNKEKYQDYDLQPADRKAYEQYTVLPALTKEQLDAVPF